MKCISDPFEAWIFHMYSGKPSRNMWEKYSQKQYSLNSFHDLEDPQNLTFCDTLPNGKKYLDGS